MGSKESLERFSLWLAKSGRRRTRAISSYVATQVSIEPLVGVAPIVIGFLDVDLRIGLELFLRFW